MFKKLVVMGMLLSLSAFAKTGQPSREMKDVLDAHAGLKPKPIDTLAPRGARLQPTIADAATVVLAKKQRVPDHFGLEKVYNIEVEGAGAMLPARVYKPAGKNLPVTVYFHGGGWVLADLDTYESSAYSLAKKSGNIVVSVEYRKSPDIQFPAAHDDAFAAYKWVLANAASIGGDRARVSVAGESAGGNLAVNVVHRARNENVQEPSHLLAIYPIAGSNMATESYDENSKAKPLDKNMMVWFFKNYFGDLERANNPQINLAAANYRGFPASTILLAEIDPLRSEGQALAAKMKADGVRVTSKVFKGATHEFFGLGDIVPQAREAQAIAARALQNVSRTPDVKQLSRRDLE